MFDWIKSRFPGRNGKYGVPQIAKNDIIEKSKSRVQQDLQHKVQVTVTKHKEINIISPSAEIVEITSCFKQSPIENFLTSDDEPTSSETVSFKDFTDCSSRLCSIDSNSLEQTSQLSNCVLVDLIQFKEQNSKTCSFETDSDSGRSSLSCQSSGQSCESRASIKNPIHGHTKADSRTSLYLSDSEYSFDSQCLNFTEIHSNNLSEESVCLSDKEYSFDCLNCKSQPTDQSRMESFTCKPQSYDQDRTVQLSKTSVCLSDNNSCYSLYSDSNSLHSVKLDIHLTQSLSKSSACLSDFCYSFDSDNLVLQSFNRSYIRSVSKSSVCLSDSNYSFDTNPESIKEAIEDELPAFNPKNGFGLNRWYKH